MPRTPGRPLIDRPVEQRRTVQREGGLRTREVDPLPFAGTLPVDDGEQDRHRHVVRAGVVHEGIAPPGRLLVTQPRRERQPGYRLHHRAPGLELAIRPTVAETAMGNVDDVGFQLLQPLVTKSPPLEHAFRKVLGHDIGNLDELGQDLLAAFRPKVQRDAVLFRVVVVEATAEVDAALPVDGGRPAAQYVPAALVHWIFDANHLGAEGGEPLRRARSRQLAGEVADAKRRQGFGHG